VINRRPVSTGVWRRTEASLSHARLSAASHWQPIGFAAKGERAEKARRAAAAAYSHRLTELTRVVMSANPQVSIASASCMSCRSSMVGPPAPSISSAGAGARRLVLGEGKGAAHAHLHAPGLAQLVPQGRVELVQSCRRWRTIAQPVLAVLHVACPLLAGGHGLDEALGGGCTIGGACGDKLCVQA
jgi:hypothetical protein